MIDWIAGAYTSLTAAKDITKAILEIKEAAAVSGKALELNGVILDVQDKLFNARTERDEMQATIRELESRLNKLETWEVEKARYQLAELAPGTLVYRLKEEMQGNEPAHDLCPNCWEQGAKSILQIGGKAGGSWYESFTCPKCKSDFRGRAFKL